MNTAPQQLTPSPLGLFWGWNVCSFFMFLIALSMAEICSAFPTAGGLYYWTCRMRPDAKWLGFYTGNIYVRTQCHSLSFPLN